MMALAVGERKHEIGVRLALGATPSTVIRSMMKQVLATHERRIGSRVCCGLGDVDFDVARHRRYRASRRHDLRSFVSAADCSGDGFIVRATDTNLPSSIQSCC